MQEHQCKDEGPAALFIGQSLSELTGDSAPSEGNEIRLNPRAHILNLQIVWKILEERRIEKAQVAAENFVRMHDPMDMPDSVSTI